MSIGRDAEVVAARQRDPGRAAAGQQRTEHRRSRPGSARPGRYGATGSTVGGLVSRSVRGLGARWRSERTPRRVEQLAHELDVDDVGHVRELVGALGEDGRRHQLEHGVLGAAHRHRAGQRAGRPHGDRTHPVSMLARCPGWRRAGRAREADPDLFRPRRDLVLEAEDGPGRFVQAEGPFQHYERHGAGRGGRLDHRDHHLPARHPVVRLAVRAARLARSLQRAPSHRPHGGRSRGGRRRSASTPGRPTCSGCSPRRS